MTVNVIVIVTVIKAVIETKPVTGSENVQEETGTATENRCVIEETGSHQD